MERERGGRKSGWEVGETQFGRNEAGIVASLVGMLVEEE
jgi:hypothetical protein